MSTILCKAFEHKFPENRITYLKPVSTGPENEADDKHIKRFAPGITTKCLFKFDDAVSPHIAARSSKVRSPLAQILQSLMQMTAPIRLGDFGSCP
jgi:dethiobiotin synthetase/adenosylmethionine--8-amino-7-oxononanoate aminotransferase